MLIALASPKRKGKRLHLLSFLSTEPSEVQGSVLALLKEVESLTGASISGVSELRVSMSEFRF